MKFWKFKQLSNLIEETNETVTENILELRGVIADETWWGDEVTPQLFKDELANIKGDLTVWINSPGGDVFAASEIYTALKEHKGKITIKIDSLAASAASVIAMSGDMVYMSPTSMMMCHNPSMGLFGEVSQLEDGIVFLNEIKESIINAYQIKTGLSRNKISKIMDNETWLNAKSALEMGFCDKILYDEKNTEIEIDNLVFDKKTMVTNTISAMKNKLKPIKKDEENGESISNYETRLNLLGGITHE